MVYVLDADGLASADHVLEVRATTAARLEQVADWLVPLPPRPVLVGVRVGHNAVLVRGRHLNNDDQETVTPKSSSSRSGDTNSIGFDGDDSYNVQCMPRQRLLSCQKHLRLHAIINLQT